MHFSTSKSLAVLLAASTSFLGASASPFARRAAETTAASSSSSSSTSTSSSSSTAPTVALIVTTISGTRTTLEYYRPTSTGSKATATGAVTTTADSAITSASPSTTGGTATPVAASNFPSCTQTATPFCLPANDTEVYYGETYYVTWNPDFYGGASNSTLTVILNYANDSTTQAYSSSPIQKNVGMTTITMQKAWLQGYSRYNLTLYAHFYDPTTSSSAVAYTGPYLSLTNKPPSHYKPPAKNTLQKEGLMIGLPVALGFVILVVIGLYFGMRHQRHIGLGNVMGRRRGGGYGTRQSKRQRLGLGKAGAIRLEQREMSPELEPEYRDEVVAPPRRRSHARDESLGSLVTDDETTTPPRAGNAFRDEVERQRTGRP